MDKCTDILIASLFEIMYPVPGSHILRITLEKQKKMYTNVFEAQN